MKFILFILAAVFFAAAALRVSNPLFDWTPAAFYCLTVGLLLV
jgi:hypothetical protein